MRISFLALALILAASVTPAFAQHSSHGSHGSGTVHGAPPQHSNGGNGGYHPGPQGQRGGFGPAQHGSETQFHDNFGHAFYRSDFGRDHFVRFGFNDGRWYGGRHEFFFGGFWFAPYGGVIWPNWFYGCSTYFDIGPDGYWYAYCYDNPGLYIRVFVP
jgi:hypothetical protein